MFESEITRFSCPGIDIDNIILESRLKLTCFQSWGRNELGFCMRGRNRHGFSLHIDLIFVRRSEVTSFFVFGPKFVGFDILIEIDLVFVYALGIT